MKLAGLVYKWILLSLAMSLALLLFLNNVYFSNRQSLPSISPENDTVSQEKENVEPKNVSLPTGAKNISISFMNTYISCILDGKLKIFSVEDNKEVKTITPEQGSIESSLWTEEGDIILYATNVSNGGSNEVKLRAYDMDTQETNSNYDAITELPETSVVEKIQTSRATSNTYLQIKTSETKKRIYQYNIMNYLKRVRTVTDAKEIWEMFIQNKILYLNDNNKIMVYDGDKSGEPSRFATKFTYSILGIDSTDRIFIGILDDNDKIKRILYGSWDDFEKIKFKEQYLTTPQPKENIFVTQIGNIYISDGLGKLLEIESKEEKDIDGKVLIVRDEGILTQNENELKFIPFNT